MGLSIIMPFTEKVPEVIPESSLEVILIQDGGKEPLYTGSHKYIFNPEKKGLAQCINLGITASQGDVVCYIPADSKIVGENWQRDIYVQAMGSTRTLFGIGWENHNGILVPPSRYFDAKLNSNKAPKNRPTHISNGGFFVHRRYYTRLGGLRLLRGDNFIGRYLGIKAWLEGGSVEVGDSIKLITKSKESNDTYDKLVLILTCFPEQYIDEFLPRLQEEPDFEAALELINVNAQPIDDIRRRLNLTNYSVFDYARKFYERQS